MLAIRFVVDGRGQNSGTRKRISRTDDRWKSQHFEDMKKSGTQQRDNEWMRKVGPTFIHCLRRWSVVHPTAVNVVSLH